MWVGNKREQKEKFQALNCRIDGKKNSGIDKQKALLVKEKHDSGTLNER